MSTSTTFQGLIPKLVVRKMADMEPTIGKHSAWKMVLRDLIKMARACGSEFSPIGMLDELLSDAQLAQLPGNPRRQNRALVPIVAGCHSHNQLQQRYYKCLSILQTSYS